VSSVDAPEDNDASSNARRIQNITTIRAASNSSTKPDLLEGAEKDMQDTEVLNYNPSAKSARESRKFD
jgi:hypothetical protein